MKIYLLVECKSFKLPINKKFFSQVSVYNKVYKSKYVMISNGLKHFVCEFDWNKESYVFWIQYLSIRVKLSYLDRNI